MKLLVSATVEPIKNGVAVRCPQLRLVGHGKEQVEAVESLRRGIRAWCLGLQRSGRLESALGRRGMKWQPDGDGLMVEVSVPYTV